MFLEGLGAYADDARVLIHPVQGPRLTETGAFSTPPGSLFLTVLNPGLYLQGKIFS